MRTHTAVVDAGVGPVRGTVVAPGSKSVTHRAVTLAANALEPVQIVDALWSQDTRATVEGLQALGATIERRGGRWVVHGPLGGQPDVGGHAGVAEAVVDCGNSGTTMRFLCGTAARFTTGTSFTGDASLRRRPHDALLRALAEGGATVTNGPGGWPVRIQGPLLPGRFHVPDGASSQCTSSLLLSLPFLEGCSQVVAPASGYVDLTLDVMQAFGIEAAVQVRREGATFDVPGAQEPTASVFHVEGDWSSAAFPMVAAAVTGGDITMEGLRLDSLQPDRVVLKHLEAFGCRVDAGPTRVRVRGEALRSPGCIDVSGSPDLFPALAVVAACAEGTTRFVGGAALRGKESDRIAAMAEGLARMRTACRPFSDGLEVDGGNPRAAAIDSRGDHRVHMAFAVAALAVERDTDASGPSATPRARGPAAMRVSDPSCVSVSYPGFYDMLAEVTGSADAKAVQESSE